MDGHASEDASLQNRALIDALRQGGDALNVQGDFPTLEQNNRRASYSPLWEAQFGEWTKKAVSEGLNTRQTDEFQILNLAKTRPDLLTAPGGAPYGSMKALINCPVIAFLDKEPKQDLVDPLPGSAVDFPGAYLQNASTSGGGNSPHGAMNTGADGGSTPASMVMPAALGGTGLLLAGLGVVGFRRQRRRADGSASAA